MFNLQPFEAAYHKIAEIYSEWIVWVEAYSRIERYINAIQTSILNIDSIFWLFDIEDESNKKNLEWWAEVIDDHMSFRYTQLRPWSTMLDYELTLVLANIHKIASILIKLWQFNVSPELKKAYNEYWAIKKDQFKTDKEQAEAQRKQQEEITKQMDDAQAIADREKLPAHDNELLENIDNI